MQNKSSKEKSKLNDYHQKRNKVACKEVEEMLKQPLSLDQAKEQTQKFLTGDLFTYTIVVTDQEAKDFATDIFDRIKKSKTIADLERIEPLKIMPKYRMKIDQFPKIEFDIKPDEIRVLIDNKIIDKELNFSNDITSKLTDTLTKLLYATAWKNGDLKKIKHIIKGILDHEDVNDNQEEALVFYQFGKYLTKTLEQPIIDQHVIRAFGIYKATDNKDITDLRKLQTLNKKQRDLISAYKIWLTSEGISKELRQEMDYTYYIDKLLYATGKTIKINKQLDKNAQILTEDQNEHYRIEQ